VPVNQPGLAVRGHEKVPTGVTCHVAGTPMLVNANGFGLQLGVRPKKPEDKHAMSSVLGAPQMLQEGTRE
jgi:hypothetical protein